MAQDAPKRRFLSLVFLVSKLKCSGKLFHDSWTVCPYTSILRFMACYVCYVHVTVCLLETKYKQGTMIPCDTYVN